MKDIGFRLFGRTIEFGPKEVDINSRVDQVFRDYNGDYECSSSSDNSKQVESRARHEINPREEPKIANQEGNSPKSNKGSHSTITEDSNNKDLSDQTSNYNPKDRKPLKKPDQILPCPRCNSMATKFCYFNNYNFSQPRHFCKDCQRYWTAGGTMRSVPVGSGRRKPKNSSISQNRYQPYGFVQNNLNTNFSVLPSQGPYMLSPVRWQTGFPVPFQSSYSPTGNWNLQSRSGIHPDQASLPKKHSRDNSAMLLIGTLDSDSKNKPENGRVVRAKLTTIDDPIETANSSIWTTLHNKNKHANLSTTPMEKVGFFGLHNQRSKNYESVETSSVVMEFNPSAFARSLSFQGI